MRLELWGTFDIDNFGDQLFPIAMSHVARSCGYDVAGLASPWGGPVPGWGDEDEHEHAWTRRIVPVEEIGFLAQLGDVDAVLVPGGDVIAQGPFHLRRPDGSSQDYPMKGLARDLLLLGAATPVGWHAIGVTAPLEGVMGGPRAADVLLQNLAAVSVRDSASAATLAPGLPAGRRTRIFSDVVWLLPGIWDRAALAERRRQLADAHPLPPGYVVVHASFLGEHRGAFVEQVGHASRRCAVVLLSLAPCQGDDGDLEEIAAATGATVVSGVSVYDRAAILAGAGAYVGTAFHGGVVAASYGIPTAWIRDVPKIRVGDEQLGRREARVLAPHQLDETLRRMAAGAFSVDPDRTTRLASLAFAQASRTLAELAHAVTEGSGQ